jgi:hypothetical protein
MSLRKILVLDGVTAVCRFRDDGVVMEAEGVLPQNLMERLARFAQWYRRMVWAMPICCPVFADAGLVAVAGLDRGRGRDNCAARAAGPCLRIRRAR